MDKPTGEQEEPNLSLFHVLGTSPEKRPGGVPEVCREEGPVTHSLPRVELRGKGPCDWTYLIA